MKYLLALTAVAAAVAVVLIATSGGSSNTATGSSPSATAAATTPAGPAAATVALRQNPLGRILVDRAGRTLYLFEADKPDHSACTGSCASIWPPVMATGAPVAGAGLDRALLGTIAAPGGGRQVTYAHHPLYTYAADQKPGDATGEGLDQFGAEWYVVGAHGTKIEHD